MTTKPKMNVYYNSACPVCNAGIEGQKGKESTCDIQWNDIHKHNELAAEVSAKLEFARERLHLVDEQGNLQVGFEAFLALWRNSPTETWKAKILSAPIIRQVCGVVYGPFPLQNHLLFLMQNL